jgi:RNA polymerase sigma-70 factor (ECF subfamily)
VSSDSRSDRALIDAFLARRSEDAFTAIYERHAPRMYGLARRLLGSRADAADDVLQMAWMRAAARLDGFRGESALSTWLCGFVVNCCREQSPSRLLSIDDVAMPAVASELDAPIEVHRALAALADGYRAVLVLHDVEGYTHAEIGALLGIEPGTSKSQLSRARRAMQISLAKGVSGDG